MSGEPGVSFHKGVQLWEVRVCKGRKAVFRHRFEDKDEAIRIAQEKRREIHGEFVRDRP
jgi:hypothetical protein